MQALFAAGTGLSFSFLRVVRMLRLLRVLRLMRSWKGLYDTVVTLGAAMKQMSSLLAHGMLEHARHACTRVRTSHGHGTCAACTHRSNLFVLLLLFCLIFALLGMQVFGGVFSVERGYSPVPCPGGLCPEPSLQV